MEEKNKRKCRCCEGEYPRAEQGPYYLRDECPKCRYNPQLMKDIIEILVKRSEVTLTLRCEESSDTQIEHELNIGELKELIFEQIKFYWPEELKEGAR